MNNQSIYMCFTYSYYQETSNHNSLKPSPKPSYLQPKPNRKKFKTQMELGSIHRGFFVKQGTQHLPPT